MFKPFSQYAMLLITLNALHVASSAITFFSRITAHWIFFFRQVSLAGIFLWGGRELSPHLRLFLMVRPLVIHK